MAKTKYWLADGYGGKALVEGADERDRWLPLGWSESSEPQPGERVWLRHEEHGGRALFPAESVELWRQKGWQPSDPPEPINPFNTERPADVAEPAQTSSPAPAGKSSSDSPKEK